MNNLLWLILAASVLVILWLVYLYNSLITWRNRTDESWSDIDVQLKRRYNLIPNLVETVKAYARHELSVFTKVTEARGRAMGAQTVEEHAKAENILSDTLKSLFAVAENYPDLKSSQNFLQLQDELKDAEDKIQAARRFYNGNVRTFNITIQKFPNNLLAKTLGFTERKYFELKETKERAVPGVKF